MRLLELRVPPEVRAIRESIALLRRRFPQRPFTMDGRLVGDLGEVVAAEAFGLHLQPWNTPGHDALVADGCSVEVKATASPGPRTRIGFSKNSTPTTWLVVMSFPPERPDVAVVEYAGPGAPVWAVLSAPREDHHQVSVSLSRIRSIAANLRPEERLQLVSMVPVLA